VANFPATTCSFITTSVWKFRPVDIALIETETPAARDNSEAILSRDRSLLD
jgi:hypothetical protein